MYANPVLHFKNSEDSIKCVSAYDLRYDYGGLNASNTLWINWIIAAHICAGEMTSLVLGDIFKYIGLYFSFTEVCFQWSHWWPTDPSIPYTMMTSSNRNIFRVTDPLCGEFPGEFPSQRPVTRGFDVFFDLRMNKLLSKQEWGWWFETLSCSLWRHCDTQGRLCRKGFHIISSCLYSHAVTFLFRPV